MSGDSPRAMVPSVRYASAWLRAFLQQGSGLVFDEEQAAQIMALAERKTDRLSWQHLARSIGLIGCPNVPKRSPGIRDVAYYRGAPARAGARELWRKLNEAGCTLRPSSLEQRRHGM